MNCCIWSENVSQTNPVSYWRKVFRKEFTFPISGGEICLKTLWWEKDAAIAPVFKVWLMSFLPAVYQSSALLNTPAIYSRPVSILSERTGTSSTAPPSSPAAWSTEPTTTISSVPTLSALCIPWTGQWRKESIFRFCQFNFI